MRGEEGQATIEWTGLVLLVAVALGALLAVVPVVDGRSFGALVAHRITCTARGDCGAEADALAAAYGETDAELVRRYVPGLVYEPGEKSLPVDFRECRAARCSAAPDDRDLDGHRTDTGLPATMFTHVVRRGEVRYLQFWLYYPESNTTLGPANRPWNWVARKVGPHVPVVEADPYHRDDWEGVQVRVDGDGTATVRATSHGHYKWCKQSRCKGRWGPFTGWSRVSRDSHAGHIPLRQDPQQHDSPIRVPYSTSKTPLMGYNPDSVGYTPQTPGNDLRERTSTAPGMRLIPLESVDQGAYEALDEDIKPPWRKDVYDNPESDDS